MIIYLEKKIYYLIIRLVLGQIWKLTTLYNIKCCVLTYYIIVGTAKYINKALDDGKKTIGNFFGSKAFDTVNHTKLLKILPDFGIKNVSLKWFNSYLANRSQIVKINGVFSNHMTLNFGEPQVVSMKTFVYSVFK